MMPGVTSRRLALLLPMAAIVPVGVMFWHGLWQDPHLVPSPLTGKAVPVFSLPPVKGRTLGLSSADLTGDVLLVNVFASWCVACRAEHPVLMQMRAAGVVPIHGLNYKDKPDDAAKWLDSMGDPYRRSRMARARA